MSDPIGMICELANCSRDEADRAYEKTRNVVDAVDMLLEVPSMASSKYTCSRVTHQLSEEDREKKRIREILERFDKERATSLDQHVDEGSSVKLVPREETVLQNNCSQQCQLPSLQEGVQIPETVCPSQSECSCDSQ